MLDYEQAKADVDSIKRRVDRVKAAAAQEQARNAAIAVREGRRQVGGGWLPDQ